MNENRALHHICRDGHAVRVGDYYLPQMETATLRGELFHCFGELVLAQGATKICQLKTGNVDTYAYGLRLQSNITVLTYQIRESPTITDGTTALSPINFDRTSDNEALYRIYTDPTNVSGGTLIKDYRHYSLPNAPVQTSMEGNGTFMLLKRNTSYSLTFINGDNNERKIFAQFIIGENK